MFGYSFSIQSQALRLLNSKYILEFNKYKAYVISQGGTIQDEVELKKVFKKHS